MSTANTERKIVIGLITSTDFIKQVREVFSSRYLVSPTAKRIAAWCIEFYDKYETAPGKGIEDIFYEKVKNGLQKELAEEIEQSILPELSEEFINTPELLNIPHLVDITRNYFSEKNIELLAQQLEIAIAEGKINEAEELIQTFKALTIEKEESVDFSKKEALQNVERAFAEPAKPLITFPRALGEFWNDELVPGGFVAFLAPEKRGKSYWMMEFSKRAVKNGYNVAFFQAGDMSEGAQLRRFCINLTKNSDKEKYCGEMYQPVRDCILNQLNTCDNPDRECDFGVFESMTAKEVKEEVTINGLKQALEDNPAYSPCYNCKEYKTRNYGVPWIKKVVVKEPLDERRAKRAFHKYFIKNKRSLRLSTHANGTLSTEKIESILSMWYKKYAFIPHVIIIDYADLLVCKEKIEFRHQQNQIWKNLRGISQKVIGGVEPLVITATQADADSYDKDILTLKNFSEDKRKYAHVTAMFGLNQDKKGREKGIGIMRINELLKREGDFHSGNVVHVLQNLKRGQPFLGSYF